MLLHLRCQPPTTQHTCTFRACLNCRRTDEFWIACDKCDMWWCGKCAKVRSCGKSGIWCIFNVLAAVGPQHVNEAEPCWLSHCDCCGVEHRVVPQLIQVIWRSQWCRRRHSDTPSICVTMLCPTTLQHQRHGLSMIQHAPCACGTSLIWTGQHLCCDALLLHTSTHCQQSQLT